MHHVFYFAEDRAFSPLQKTGGLPPLAFAAENGTLVTSGLYRMIHASRDPSQQTKNTFWNSRAPPRVQYFTWLLLHGSLQCKANLFQKKIVDDVTCDLCMGHLRLQSICCSSAPFQRPFGRSDATAHDLLHLHRPETLPMAHYDTFILLCHWQL